MEAESEAVGMLVAGDGLESKFAALEGGTVEDELAALKAGALAGPKQVRRMPGVDAQLQGTSNHCVLRLCDDEWGMMLDIIGVALPLRRSSLRRSPPRARRARTAAGGGAARGAADQGRD